MLCFNPVHHMDQRLVIGKVASDFEVQAELFCRLKTALPWVKGEARATFGGRKLRFDLLCKRTSGLLFAVEVKPARSARWREMWKTTPQFKCYDALPIPVYMVLGSASALRFSECGDWPERAGVVWPEDWQQS